MIRDRGRDPDEVWEEMAAEAERMAALGLSPPAVVNNKPKKDNDDAGDESDNDDDEEKENVTNISQARRFTGTRRS